MNEQSAKIINIAQNNAPVPGCTVSKQLYFENEYGISYFSLASHTEISAETYAYSKLIMVYEGQAKVYYQNGKTYVIKSDESIVTMPDSPVGIITDTDCVYVEISLRKDSNMNQIIKSGEVFKLGELLPYQDNKIINMDIVNDEKMKLVIMSFDKGTGLTEHAAPGEALVMALDGIGLIGYEGKEYSIKAGETFKFDKNGKHYVKATEKFKMALLLVF